MDRATGEEIRRYTERDCFRSRERAMCVVRGEGVGVFDRGNFLRRIWPQM